MFGVDDAIIAAGITAAAGLYGASQANSARASVAGQVNAAGMAIADADRRDAQYQYRTTMEFQERMANSAYQRGIADMRAAGLNPILAYKQGGATSPAGGGGVRGGGVPLQVPGVENVLGPAVSAAFQTAQVVQGLEATKQQISQSRAQTGLIEAETNRSNQEASRIVAETARSGEQTELTRRMQQTEIERQRQIAADAALSSARTATEGHTGRLRAEEARRYERYGPPGTAQNAAAAAEAVGNRVSGGAAGAGDWIGRLLGGWFYGGRAANSRTPHFPGRDAPPTGLQYVP